MPQVVVFAKKEELEVTWNTIKGKVGLICDNHHQQNQHNHHPPNQCYKVIIIIFRHMAPVIILITTIVIIFAIVIIITIVIIILIIIMIKIARHMELVIQPSSLTAYFKYTQGPGKSQQTKNQMR